MPGSPPGVPWLLLWPQLDYIIRETYPCFHHNFPWDSNSRCPRTKCPQQTSAQLSGCGQKAVRRPQFSVPRAVYSIASDTTCGHITGARGFPAVLRNVQAPCPTCCATVGLQFLRCRTSLVCLKSLVFPDADLLHLILINRFFIISSLSH